MSLNRRLVEASRGVVVHSEWARDRIQQYENAPPIEVIPFGIASFEEDGGRFGGLVRRLLGIPQNGFVFGIFGNLHPVKRVPVILRAFKRIHERYPDACLFLMGPVSPSTPEVVHQFQRDPRAARANGIYLHLAYASYDLMLMAMQAVDVGINLRYPTAGETSGTLSMLLGEGKPTIVSNVGSFTEYPDACCPKVPVDGNEEEVLFARMADIMTDNSCYNQATSGAFDFARERTWARCAQRYLDFIDTVLADGTGGMTDFNC
jgi:glycosyltransferase involved in cell wall biosynthesis